ncbi:MAG: leucine-rich repeat domain-containing protein [Promethearchaeota archaeon]
MNKKSTIKQEESKVLTELEKLIGKFIPCIDNIEGDVVGVKVENGNIIELGLFFCGLKSLPESITKLKSIQRLSLHWNPLESVPKPLFKLKSLKILDLDATKLTTLPEDFGNLTSIQVLYLSNNQITKLPKSFGNLVSLQKLYLTNNQLEDLPASFSNLKSLEELHLQDNLFKTLPTNVIQLTSLTTLNLIGNRLTSLPTSLWRLNKLTHLWTDNNLWKNEWIDIRKNTLPVILEFCRKRDTINVFISHAWVDQDLYRIIDLKKNLEKRDEIYEVFICEKDLVGDIRKFMDEKVPQSHLFVFIATKNSINSEACQHELALALNNDIEIIPLKGMDLEWDDLNRIDLTKEHMDFFNLEQKKGFEFDIEGFEGFCDDLYHYIEQYKREINLFDTNKGRIDKQQLNIKNMIIKFIESDEFRKHLENNIKQFETIFQEISKNQISSLEYYLKVGHVLSKKSKE